MSASNDGFSTTAEVSIEIPDSELRNARQQIESEIGTVEVGMTDGGSMSAQSAGGGGGGGRERRRRRREYRWARERTSYLEDLLAVANSIEDEVGGGDGMLSDMLGGGLLGGILGGAGGAAGGIGSGVATGIGAAVGTAVGTAVSNELSDGFSVDSENFEIGIESEELESVQVGIETEEVDDVGVDVKTEQLEDMEVGVNTEAIEDFEVGVRTEELENLALEVESVGPIPVQDPGPIDVNISTSGGGEDKSIVETAISEVPSGKTALAIADEIDPGSVNDATTNSMTRAEQLGIDDPNTQLTPPSSGNGDGGGGGSAAQVTVQTGSPQSAAPEVNNDVETGDVTVDVQGFDELEKELERAFGDQIDEVMAEVEAVQDDLERLKNDIAG